MSSQIRESTTSLTAGPATFRILIADQNRVTEVELLKRPIVLTQLENLSIGRSRAGLHPGGAARQARALLPRRPQDAHPDGRRRKLSTAPNPGADAAVTRYRTWVQGQAQRLVNTTLTFADAVRAGDLERARAL